MESPDTENLAPTFWEELSVRARSASLCKGSPLPQAGAAHTVPTRRQEVSGAESTEQGRGRYTEGSPVLPVSQSLAQGTLSPLHRDSMMKPEAQFGDGGKGWREIGDTEGNAGEVGFCHQAINFQGLLLSKC